MTDAINILIYSEGCVNERGALSNNSDGYAVWLLWARQDVEPLRDYLQGHYSLGPKVDPIHSGDLCIYPEMMPDLTKHDILPYKIQQQVGQAVIIPAMTPHYVRLSCDRSHTELIHHFSGHEPDKCYENSLRFCVN